MSRTMVEAATANAAPIHELDNSGEILRDSNTRGNISSTPSNNRRLSGLFTRTNTSSDGHGTNTSSISDTTNSCAFARGGYDALTTAFIG
jgi:hypothetical protein